MAGLAYPQLGNNISPESIMEDYYQRGMADIDQRYRNQWDEVNKRASTLGPRRQAEMFGDIQARSKAEFDKFYQAAQNQAKEFQLIDRLAQQGGFDPYEAKMRIALGPEAEKAMFPTQAAPRSAALQFGELDTYKNRLQGQAEDYVVTEAGKAKRWYLPSFLESTRPAKAYVRSYDPTETDAISFEGKKGFYVPAKPQDIRTMGAIKGELQEVKARQQEIMNTPDIARRVRGAMLRIKRDPKHDSLVTRVQKSAGMEQPGPRAPARSTRQEPKREQVAPTAEQLRKLGTKQAYDEGVKLGYWE